MSEIDTYYAEVAKGGGWAHPDPDLCGCGGSGVFLSQVDTFHRCGLHATEESDAEMDDLMM